jgi:cytochrome P450
MGSSPVVAGFDAFDVFAAFDESVGKAGDSTGDIYGTLRRYRESTPVYEGDILVDEWGAPSIATIAASQVGQSVVSVFEYDDVCAVLKDPLTYSSEVYLPSLGQLHGRSFMMMDPPDHEKYRGAVKASFTRRSAEEMGREVVEPAISGLLDGLLRSGSGRADLFRDFALIFPVQVLDCLLGLRADHDDEFLRLGVSSLLFGSHPEIAAAGAARLHELLRQDVEARRAGSYTRPGLMQDLAEAEVDGRALSTEEILPYFGTLLAAGAETAMRSTLNTMMALLTNPDQRRLVQDDEALLPKAVEESLRWEPPILAVFRQAKIDTSIRSVAVPAGTAVVAWVGSANHDDAIFPDPESYDVRRGGRAQVGFGFGPHLCIGMHLARVETIAAVRLIFDRMPEIRLDPDAPTPRIVGHSFRSPVTLPVVF